mmetsp:Transcript_1524/g.3528  ORF Transcript_1524/g.3528 Transcript_1524/m.3528 type:complete len:218 (+) Transcript_1524:447-1100(+)
MPVLIARGEQIVLDGLGHVRVKAVAIFMEGQLLHSPSLRWSFKRPQAPHSVWSWQRVDFQRRKRAAATLCGSIEGQTGVEDGNSHFLVRRRKGVVTPGVGRHILESTAFRFASLTRISVLHSHIKPPHDDIHLPSRIFARQGHPGVQYGIVEVSPVEASDKGTSPSIAIAGQLKQAGVKPPRVGQVALWHGGAGVLEVDTRGLPAGAKPINGIPCTR